MSTDKIGTYKFVAEPFHVDFTGQLTMGVLGNHLLNCAGFHAEERGFGMAQLNNIHYTWVRILACQMGVGGDDSWGAPVHSQYLLPSEQEQRIAFTIQRL